MRPIIILSYWNPTSEFPSKGIFIHDQVEAICKSRSDIIFFAINILPSKRIFAKNIIENDLGQSKKIVLTIHSYFWKIIYVNPWFINNLIKNYLHKNYKDLKPTLIHSNVIFPCAIVGHLLARKYNAKHIISEHWSKAEKILNHPIYGRFALQAYHDSKAIVCVSNFLAEKIKLATGHSNIIIVSNIIDTEIFQYTPKQTRTNGIHFACCATWKAPKRLDLIIGSLLEFALKTNKNLGLHVIGNGNQTKDFLTIKIPENLTIHWAGQITKTEIAKILHQTDVFLHASDIETFSIVTAEALSTGTPVLASNTGALPELIKSSNGMLVNNNVDAWIYGLEEITKRTYDHQTIALDVSNKYSPKSIAKSIEKVYNDVVKNP